MKKKLITLILALALVLSLTGCNLVVVNTTTTKENTTVTHTDTPIDKNSLISEIYSEVYDKIESELYDQIYEEIKEEFIDGTVDYEELQERIFKVVNTQRNGNIYVTSYSDGTAQKSGSGVIYDKETITKDGKEINRYYVITNEHIYNSMDSATITFEDETTLDATIVGMDNTTDICVLSFDSENTYQVNEMGDSDDVKIGQIVLAIGNPKGMSLYGSVSMGIVGGTNRNLVSNGTTNTINEYIQHDAAINSGNSGGGLYTLDGKCVGINSQKYTSSDIEGLNFAIPSNLAVEVATEIREKGYYSGTVTLGVTVTAVENLTEQGRETYNVPDSCTDGLVVISITENSTAYDVLEEGDIIIEFDGTTVYDTTDLKPILASHHIGDTVNAKIIRNGEVVEVSLTFKRAE